jgi:hypothetical protein
MPYWNHSNPAPADSDNGLHDCARGDRCAGRKSVQGDDGKHVVVPAQTYTAYCPADRDRLAGVLGELPRRYAELAALIGDKGRPDGPRVSGGGKNPPIPINEGVDAFLRQIVEVLASWEERVRHVDRLADVSGRRRDAQAVKVACGILTLRVDALLALPPDAMYRTCDLSRAEDLPQGTVGWVHPDAGWVEWNPDLGGVEAGTEIFNLHHRLMSRLGLTPQHHDLRTACWECEIPRLRRWDGSAGLEDHVTCRNCGVEYLGDRLARLMADEANHEAAKRAS